MIVLGFCWIKLFCDVTFCLQHGMPHHQYHCQAFQAFSSYDFSCFSTFFLAPSPLPTAWAWALKVDPLGAFHLGLPWPQLYSWIPFILWWEMYITFCLPLDRLVWNMFDIDAWHLFMFYLQWCLVFPIRALREWILTLTFFV
jgi:hypothetical protein